MSTAATSAAVFRVPVASWRIIALFLVAQAVLVPLLLLYRRQILVPIAQATGWWVAPDLVAGAILIAVCVGGVLVLLGGFRARDVGVRASDLPAALAVTAAFWLITQGALAGATLATGGGLYAHPNWTDPGLAAILGFLVAMLAGTPLFEEIAYRGFLFPQAYLKLRDGHRQRLWKAALLSQAVFALLHIPNRVLLGQVMGLDLARHLAVLTMAGLFGVVLYLRTGNLLVVVGIHALVNAPTPLVQSPVSPFAVTMVLAAVLWLAWPRIAGRWVEARPNPSPHEAA